MTLCGIACDSSYIGVVDNLGMLAEFELELQAPGVYELRLPIPWEDEYVNAFLFPDGNSVDLLDCGMNSADSIAMIRSAVRQVGGSSARLRRLVVTHIHPDHYGAAGELAQKDGAELYMHRLEVPMVHPRYLELEQLVEEVRRYLLVNGVPAQLAETMSNASRALRDFVTPAAPDVQLDGAETLRLGRRNLRVLWTPGHSPGHVCLFDRDDGMLFAGDQLLPDISPNIGLHPQSTPNPLDEYVESLRLLATLEPARVFPAHGRPFSGAGARVESLIAHHEKRKLRILEILAGSERSGWEVAIALWGEREAIHEKRLALQEALAHLQSLAVAERLSKTSSAEAVRWLGLT
jgi:glyoxylase-like metal-dependent hydrolase (beta-lactamase superfamily II)